MQMALANGFAGVEQGANARQMANMQTAFGIQSQIADSTYANGSGLADLKYTVATEACADRNAVSNGVRDIIANQTAGIQQILDKLCDQELQAERRENQNLRSELMYARGQASQVDQTAQIRASQATTANQLINELRSCPIPSQPVYGNQPIFTCPNNNSGCGCGCGNF
jgi:DNA/RNA endonuclease YhcR with UshA esterase domain